jgi:hypothetical protein
MPITFNNYEERNIFENRTTWKSEGEKTAKDMGSKEWHEAQDAFLRKNYTDVIANQENAERNQVYSTDTTKAFPASRFNSSAIQNINNSIDVWNKAKDITTSKKGGMIIEWDTETIGDIELAKQIASGKSTVNPFVDGTLAVTEYGFNVQTFKNGRVTQKEDFSVLVKLNDAQVKYVENIIKKYEAGKWDDLTDAERVTLNRVSVYRDVKHIEQGVDISYLGGKFDIITDLSSEMGQDLAAVNAGLEVLKNYGTASEVLLPKFTKFLSKTKNKNVVGGGANTSQFDVNYLIAMGVNKDVAETINRNTLDVTMAQRLIALSEGVTTDELNDMVRGYSAYSSVGSNTVSGMRNALGYVRNFAAHVSGKDSSETGNILTTKDFYNGTSFIDATINAHKKINEEFYKTIMKLEDENSIILTTGGWIDKNSLDQVRVGDKITNSYSVGGNYWLYDKSKSGYRDWIPEGKTEPERVYVTTLKSATTGEDHIEYTKMHADEESAMNWVKYNTIIIDKNNIQESQIDSQARQTTLDFGRREYSSFFETNVGKAGVEDTGGHASLKKYLSAYEEVDKYLNKKGITDAAKKSEYLFTREGFEDIQSILAEKGLSYNYTQRSFIGMYKRLQNEYEVLKYISDFAETNGSKNISRTAIVRDMYNAFTELMEKEVSNKGVSNKHTYTLNDVYSIDVLGSDGKYHTIKANDADKLAAGIRRLYENKDSKNLGASLADMSRGLVDLNNRGLISDEVFNALNSSLKYNPSMFNASQRVANSLMHIFQPFEEHNAITTFKQVFTGGSNLDEATQLLIINKNVGGPPSVHNLPMLGGYRVNHDNKKITVNQFFNNSREAAEKMLHETGKSTALKFSGVNFVTNISFNDEAGEAFLNNLGEKLNYSELQTKSVSNFFNAMEKIDDAWRPKGYALNNSEAKKNGLVTAIISPNEAGNSGYIILTNKKHSSKVVDLLTGVANKDLRQHEMEELLKGNASVYELKPVKEIPIGTLSQLVPEENRNSPVEIERIKALQVLNNNQDLVTAKYVIQGENNVKYILPTLNLYSTEGVLAGGISGAGDDIARAFTRNGKHAIEYVLNDDFDAATRVLKKAVTSSFTDGSGSSSYQGIYDKDGYRVRGINFNESDALQAFKIDILDGMITASNQVLRMSHNDNLYVSLLYAFNKGLDVPIVSDDYFKNPATAQNAYKKIINSPGWQEFFGRHLGESGIEDPIGNSIEINKAIERYNNRTNRNKDAYLEALINNKDVFNKSITDIIVDEVVKDKNNHYFKPKVIESLQALRNTMHYLSRNVGESDYKRGILYLINPGEMDAASPAVSPNRPTAHQNFNVRNLKPSDWPVEYLDRVGGTLGSLSTTRLRENWRNVDNLILPDGTLHRDQVSVVTVPFKQIDSVTLSRNYDYAEKNVEELANARNLNSDLLREAISLQSMTSPSVQDDTGILSSSMITSLHNATTDTKKVEVRRLSELEDGELKEFTHERLYSLEGQVVNKGDIIGYDSGGEIRWNSFSTTFTKKNIEDLIENGVTAITPIETIASRKGFIGKSEKHMATGVIVTDELVRQMGFKSKEEAHLYLDYAHQIALMGPAVNDNNFGYIPVEGVKLGAVKHVSGGGIRSPLHIIINEYKKAGKLHILAENIASGGYGWSPEVINDASLLLYTSKDPSFIYNVGRLEEEIINNKIGDSQVNAAIDKILNYFKEQNLVFDTYQANIQSQSMGDMFVMDPRTEAVIRRDRGDKYYTNAEGGWNGVKNGVNGINGRTYGNLMMDELIESVQSGRDDYIHASDMKGRYIFNREIERRSKQKNADIIRIRRRLKEQEDVVKGIAESIKLLNNPQKLNTANIPSIHINEVLNDLVNGTISPENLSNTIFKPNAKLSNKLYGIIAEQNLQSNADMYTVKLILDREITMADGTKVIEIPVPLYNVYGKFDDLATTREDLGFSSSMGEFIKFLDTYRNNSGLPNGNAAMAKGLQGYYNSLAAELQLNDKTALGFKTMAKFPLPNSTYFLAQDQLAAVTSDMFPLYDEIRKKERQIRAGNGDLKTMLLELSDEYKKKDVRLKEIVQRIRDTGELELYGTVRNGVNYTTAANGGFLNVSAINSVSFEKRLNFDIGLFGKSLFDDIVANKATGNYDHYMTMGIRKFSLLDANISELESKVASNIKEGLEKEISADIASNFNWAPGDDINKSIEEFKITIRDLNEELIKTKKGKAEFSVLTDNINSVISNATRFIGVQYLEEIGLVTRISNRAPDFGVGVGPTNLILDETVGTGQERLFSPLGAVLRNQDQDGDGTSAAIHNEFNAMRKTGANAKEISYALNIVENNAIRNKEIIIEMIASGDAFKVDTLMDADFNNAATFKIYDKDGYEKALNEFIASLDLSEDELSGLSKNAIEFVAARSPEMKDAVAGFTQTYGNFLLNKQARIAASKAKSNKEYVGLISTASYMLHDAAAIAFERAPDDAAKQRIAELHWYTDFINTNSLDGNLDVGMNGFLTIAEQKGIDTKHILKASKITNIDLFSKGMNALMGSKRDRDKIEAALVDIMQSLNHVFFSEERDELYKIATEIINTSLEDYTREFNAAIANSNLDDATDILFRTYFRAMYELSEIEDMREAYNNPFNKIQNYEIFKEGYDNIYKYTSGSNVASKMMDVYMASSDAKLNVSEGLMYIDKGGLTKDVYGYTFNPYNRKKGEMLMRNPNGTFTADFEMHSLSKKSYYGHKTFTGKSIQDVAAQIDNFFAKDDDGNFISIETRVFNENINQAEIEKFKLNKRQVRAYSVLNEFFLPDYSTAADYYLNKMGGNLKNPLQLRPARRLQSGIGKKLFNIVNQLAGTEQSEIDEVKKLINAIAKNEKGVSEAEQFIKEMNMDIVKNPDKYANSTEFISFKGIATQRIIGIIGDNKFSDYEAQFEKIDGLNNYRKYQKAIDLLRENVYDIEDENRIITEKINDLKQYEDLNLDLINKGISDNIEKQQVIMSNLAKRQIKIIHDAENVIYGMFNSEEQFNDFFKLNSLSGETKVAFGEYIGYEFKDLSKKDIRKIKKFAKQNAEYYNDPNIDAFNKNNYQKTLKLLNEWEKTRSKTLKKDSIRTYKLFPQTAQQIEEIERLKELGEAARAQEKLKAGKKTSETAEEVIKKKTITGKAMSGAKETFGKINKKAVGITVASLAAIGIVNNLLHNEKTQSPLTPVRQNKKDTPGYSTPAESKESRKSLPSKVKTIYHDKDSGFNFKVSAVTKNAILDRDNSKMINMAGGGMSTVHTQSDTSGVTNNWLENKFAELM